MDFNCTIQELKHIRLEDRGYLDCNFNCTIQELKRYLLEPKELISIFQLHHTGIKTSEKQGYKKSATFIFQLHHTGIKTEEGAIGYGMSKRFQLHHTGIKTGWNH